MRIRSALNYGVAPTALALAMIASPAMAQETAASEDIVEEDIQEDEVDEDSLIVVSGSRIARPAGLDSTVPVTTVTAGELLNDGALSLGDALNDLPALRSTFGTSNSQRFIGTTGLAQLDLRGLGTTRTLVLVNGRRHITSNAGSFQVDVNTIPFGLLERTEIVTGGSSAIYGSDAIAGVVNFVLRDDFDGIELGGQGGISDRGDNGRFSLDGIFGKNFDDGRGNITFTAEYTRINRVFNSQRPEITGDGIGFTQFAQFDPDLGDEGFTNSDGIPDNTLQSNLFLDFISEGGTVGTFCLNGFAAQPLACDPNGNPRRFRFAADGSLFSEVTDQVPGTNLATNSTGTTLTDGTLIPQVERLNFNFFTHYDISDAIQPYFEAKYARIDTIGQGTPSFFNGICGGLGGAVGLDTSCFFDPDAASFTSANFFVSFDNAFLNPNAASTIQAVNDELLGQFGLPPGLSTGFTVNRNNSDFGTRNDSITRETYRIVAGVKGDIASNTRYDLSFNYGRFESRVDAQNDLNFANARQAVDAVFNDAGEIVCRVNADADAANDNPACVPINIFGIGAPSPEAVAFVNGTANLFSEAEQYNVLGFISSDSSNFFELPGGPVSLAVGGEWRRETAFSQPDEVSASGATFFNAFDVFDPPALEVFEAFGELRIPILADLPGFQELSLELAGRISDYNSGAGNTGTVEAWNISGIWSPFPGLRLRANRSRAVRAPTLDDLFAAQTQNFLFFDDPCDDDRINQGSATRAANCLADGVPLGFDEDAFIAGNRSVLQGGNTELEAETSNSLTIGLIFEPDFLPGFSATIDYYDIEVNNVIANVGAQAILNNCFDAADLNNAFCDAVFPRQADGFLDADAALLTGPVNFASLTAEGVDFDFRYRYPFDNGDVLSLRLISTLVLDRTNFLDTENPTFPNENRGQLGDPVWAANFNASYSTGPFLVSYSVRYVNAQFIGGRENTQDTIEFCSPDGFIPRTGAAGAGLSCTPGDLVTAPPQNPDAFEFERFPERFFHDVRVTFEVNDQFTFFAGVDNITDQLPPFGLTGGGAGSGIFNNTGRFGFAGFSANF